MGGWVTWVSDITTFFCASLFVSHVSLSRHAHQYVASLVKNKALAPKIHKEHSSILSRKKAFIFRWFVFDDAFIRHAWQMTLQWNCQKVGGGRGLNKGLLENFQKNIHFVKVYFPNSKNTAHCFHAFDAVGEVGWLVSKQRHKTQRWGGLFPNTDTGCIHWNFETAPCQSVNTICQLNF